MTVLERLGPDELRAAVRTYRDALRNHREAINRLNVYPVPDGDTGTNMTLTLDAVVAELETAGEDMAGTCKAISHGSLMGARGNSGVILSQVLRGLTGALAEEDAADAVALARGMVAAATAAYGAVMRPVEGTILTVVREAAEAAEAAAATGVPLVEVLDAASARAASALESTPELLPVLREAGVVDAGGAGFVLFLDALLHVTAGRALPEPAEQPVPDGAAPVGARPGEGAGEGPHIGEAVGDLRYEVMYLLEAPDEAIPTFKEVWAGVGDSIVVVGGEGLWNCHIHTDDIGAAIEAALDCGRPRSIRVADLAEQVQEERWVREGAATAAPAPAPEPVPTGVVAVATGDGVRRILRSLGVQTVVAGGQTMNPSTAQLLDAVEATAADEVVILPNNKNIVPVAEQVDALASKPVRVVPTASIAEGFAALLSYDPHADVDQNAAAMADAAAAVTTAEVTRAVRDGATDAGPVRAGDFVGITRTGIRAVDPTLVGATTAVLDLLVDDGHEIVTLIEGEGATAGATRQVTEWLAEHRPAVDVEVHHGGQPLWPYLISVE